MPVSPKQVTGTGFTYDQSTIPSNPIAGQTWRERNGDNTIKRDWEYRNFKWLSLLETTYFSIRIFTSSSSTFGFDFLPLDKTHDIFITRLNIIGGAKYGAVNWGESNHWTFSLSKGETGNGALGWPSFYSYSHKTTQDVNLNLDVNSFQSVASDYPYNLNFVATNTGTPTSIGVLFFNVSYRLVRK